MNTSTIDYQDPVSRRTKVILATVIGLLVLTGLVRGESVERTLGYQIVLAAALLPSILWIRMGGTGIPILPAMALAYIPYFAWPLINRLESTVDYTSSEMLRAALTVALFLVTATVAWQLTGGKVRSRNFDFLDRTQAALLLRFASVGIAVGILFHTVIMQGWIGLFGAYLGLVRSIAVTFVVVACFLTGAARASGLLRDAAWRTAVVSVCLLVLLAWSSLFLVGGSIYLLAIVFGYVTIAKRIPWFAIMAIAFSVAVLHAGKAEMRTQSWMKDMNYGREMSLTELPEFAARWVGAGISATFTLDSDNEPRQDVLDRVSLLQMILMVQRDTPYSVDYLNGETYAFLPSVLMPRFVEANKPASQVAMNLLNVRYGLLTEEGTDVTAIGWGLVAEAYANFGYLGVIGLALLVGAYCAALAKWSANATMVSIPTLFSVATLMQLVNLESDFIQLFLTLLQSFASVYIFLKLYIILLGQSRKPL